MKKLLFAFLAAALVIIFTGCSKINDSNGHLVVKITDAPFPINLIESATVTITKVEIRKVGDGISDGNPFMVLWEGSEKFDLLELRNGVVEELLDVEIPAGEYNLIRLYVDEAGLKVKDGESYSVKVPSGKQTGIKLFVEPGLVVEGGLTSELLLDFDLSNSFVLQGNIDSPAGIKGFNFKPVIRAVNSSKAGKLEGVVTDKDNVKIDQASIVVKQDGADDISVLSDANGYYAVIGLLSGTYSVVASKENYETVTINDVKIVSGNKTVLNFVLQHK